ncbi:unnamed protein product, partial [Amoebophrya sp. A120]
EKWLRKLDDYEARRRDCNGAHQVKQQELISALENMDRTYEVARDERRKRRMELEGQMEIMEETIRCLDDEKRKRETEVDSCTEELRRMGRLDRYVLKRSLAAQLEERKSQAVGEIQRIEERISRRRSELRKLEANRREYFSWRKEQRDRLSEQKETYKSKALADTDSLMAKIDKEEEAFRSGERREILKSEHDVLAVELKLIKDEREREDAERKQLQNDIRDCKAELVQAKNRVAELQREHEEVSNVLQMCRLAERKSENAEEFGDSDLCFSTYARFKKLLAAVSPACECFGTQVPEPRTCQELSNPNLL